MAAEETLQATVDALKAQVEKNEVSALASCAVLHHAPPSHRLAATPAPAAESNGHLLSPVCRLSGLPYAGRVCSARRWIDPNEVGEEHPPGGLSLALFGSLKALGLLRISVEVEQKGMQLGWQP